MERIIKPFIFLAVTVQLASAVTHSMRYIYTGVTSGINYPEFTSVGLVDEQQFVYYDSNIRTRIPKTEWIKEAMTYEQDFWNKNPEKPLATEELFKANIATAMQRFNQTEGVHTVQVMYGCELHDDGTKKAYWGDSYDGEDFLIFDLNTLTYIAPTPQAVITKLKWDSNTVPPEVSLFQKDSSSPVVCHATGFFPKSVNITWQKNREDMEEDVDLRETLPNQDGTFQKRNILTVSPEELNKHDYTCIVQHSDKKMVLPVSDRRVLSDGRSVGVIAGAVVVVLLLVVICGIGVFTWRKKQSGFKPVSENPNAPAEEDSLSNTS